MHTVYDGKEDKLVENISDETLPQGEDYTGGQALSESDRKLHSLLELGQIIGLDLQIDEMLLQIAQKAIEVMNADRFSLFLYDKTTDELFTTVAIGMGKKEIRIPSSDGIAGHCFQTGETLNIPDVYEDPRFLKTVDRATGYHTKSVLCMPFLGRSGQRLGVVELINKRGGKPLPTRTRYSSGHSTTRPQSLLRWLNFRKSVSML